YANLDRSSRLVGSEKRVAFRQGLRSVLPWLEVKEIDDRSEQVEAELREKGILKETPPEKGIDKRFDPSGQRPSLGAMVSRVIRYTKCALPKMYRFQRRRGSAKNV